MKIYAIHDLTNSKVLELLETGLKSVTESHILKNYHPSYRNNAANLFYILENGRYKNGKYFIITDDLDNYIASAGWNEYSADTALCLTRMYVSSKHRSSFVVGETILPKIFAETTQYSKLWMTVNDYNKPLYNWFVRNQLTSSMGNWPEIYKKFKPIGQKTVNYTMQHVLEYDKSKENS